MSPFGVSGPASPDNEAIRELRDEVKKMNKTAGWTNGIMIFLTFAIFVLTIVLAYQGINP